MELLRTEDMVAWGQGTEELLRTEDMVAWGQGTEANPVQMKQGQFINMETVGPVRMDAIAVGAAMGILRQQEWDVMELLRTEDTVAWGQGTEDLLSTEDMEA